MSRKEYIRHIITKISDGLIKETISLALDSNGKKNDLSDLLDILSKLVADSNIIELNIQLRTIFLNSLKEEFLFEFENLINSYSCLHCENFTVGSRCSVLKTTVRQKTGIIKCPFYKVFVPRFFGNFIVYFVIFLIFISNGYNLGFWFEKEGDKIKIKNNSLNILDKEKLKNVIFPISIFLRNERMKRGEVSYGKRTNKRLQKQ